MIRVGWVFLLFALLRPVGSGAYPAGSAKSKKDNPPRPLRLCGELLQKQETGDSIQHSAISNH